MAKGKRLKKDLSEHKRVGIDTSVFIHHFEGGELSELTTVLLERVQDGHCTGVVSTVTLAEVMVKPIRMGLDSLADLYRLIFYEMPHLETVAMGRSVAARAASLRAEHGLRLADGVVLASALEAGATALVTDREVFDAVKGLQVIQLKEYLE